MFFALEVGAPWPEKYPKGRILDEASRHLTLAFLGNIDYAPLKDLLPTIPQVPFRVGMTGHFDKCLLLPEERRPRVVAWHVKWLDETHILPYQQVLTTWLKQAGYAIEDRPFLSHVTIARSPFNAEEWQRHFTPLPMIIRGLHLYESKGNLTYIPIWSAPLIPPFEEFEHTADIAFRVRGENLAQLQTHAQIALAFKFPPLLAHFENIAPQKSLEEVIISLNRLITIADQEYGCPFKAVSFHGDTKNEEGTLTWEMIVDV